MSAPLGAEVGITYDTDVLVYVGDYLRSPKSGRTWLITASREVNRRVLNEFAHRQRLRAVVVPEDQPETDAEVFPCVWMPRRKR